MITEIRLKNFKVFEEESFNIKPLTLITGVNGMGKSTIIQSCYSSNRTMNWGTYPTRRKNYA